jgi:hypothetical protein
LDVRRTFGGLVLPGLSNDRSGVAITFAALTAVLLSRLLLLPDGPWEQDEALFAAGVLDFDVTRHRPHPPGFPGWIVLGRLMHLLVGDPVLALQVTSSLASVVLFWALAQLLSTIIPGGRATALALAFTVSPLAWVHAGRAFSTTPALAFAAVGLLLFVRARSQVVAWALLAVAGLIRPQLAPELGLIALVGATSTRDRKTTLVGLVVATVIALAGILFVAASGPSTDAVQRSFLDHFGRHRGGLGRSLEWSELGIVRGLMHPLAAAAVAGIAGIGVGLGVRSTADRRRAAWVLVLLATTAWMILRQHHPGFPRYAVVLLLVCMPGLGWSLAALPVRLGWLITVLASLVGIAASLGILLWMHAAPLPVVAATRLATTDRTASSLAYSHGAFSFARLQTETSGLRGVDVVDPDAALQLPQHAYTLEGRTLHTLEGVTACTLELPPAPPQAMLLGQGRFDRARLSRDAVVLGAGVYTPELDEAGDRYAWVAERAELHLPAGAERVHVRLEVPDDVDGASATLSAGDARVTQRLAAGPDALQLVLPSCHEGCSASLEVDGRHVPDDDPRTLTVRLEAAWVEGDGYRPAYARWSPGHPRTVRAHDVQLEGFEQPETFGMERRGAWTSADASARMPARPGRLRVQLARPEHSPGQVILQSDAESRTLEVGPRVLDVELRTNAPDGWSTLRIRTPTFRPADVRDGSSDTRELGLILYDVTFIPDGDPCHR